MPKATDLHIPDDPESTTSTIKEHIHPSITSSPQPRSLSLRTAITNKLTKRFPQFSSFPTEIRMQVWAYALPEARVHELHPCSKLLENGKMMFRSNHSAPPVLLSVSHEARTVALNNYQLMDYDAPSGTKGIRKFYFDPTCDTLFLNTLMGLYMAFMLLENSLDFDSPLGRGVMKGWQNVALDADRAHLLDLLAGHHGHPASPRLREVFPDLRKFTIAFDFTKKGKTRFRTSVWPGENGTTLKVLEGNTGCLQRLFAPIVNFASIEYSDHRKEGEIPIMEMANVKRKRYLRGDVRYGFRKTCALLKIRPPGVFMRL